MKTFSVVLMAGIFSASLALAQTPQEILQEFGLTRITVDMPARVIRRQEKLPNVIGFEEALRLSIRSFLEDGSDCESPLALVLDDLSHWDKAKAEVFDFLNRPSSVIRILRLNEKAEGGEDARSTWIFFLDIPDLSDHLHWAVVDRMGKEKVYNYGFN